MRVLIIPEDCTNDQHILKPLIEAMLQALGKPRAVVRVCLDPRFQGVTQVMNWQKLQPVLDRYRGMTDLFLICVDRDGDAHRRAALDELERRATEMLPGKIVLAENAWQEIEVWLLAGHDLPKEWDWQRIRAEVHPKENYYLPFAAQRNVHNEVAEGRKTLAVEASRRYTRIRQLCPEDVLALETRLRQHLQQTV